jgi:DNA-binding response OmpR family regulator
MKKKILVVEGDRDIREIISYILEEEGYEPILCYPEAEIIELIQLHEPDAILLDIIELSDRGTELCRSIKADKTTGHIPVIVLSTHSKIEKVKEVCADEVIRKPFDITVLLDVLKEQMAA